MMSQNPSMDYKEIIKQNALNKIKVEQANESDTKEEEEEESESDSEMYSSESMSVDSNNNEFQVPTNDLVSFKEENCIQKKESKGDYYKVNLDKIKLMIYNFKTKIITEVKQCSPMQDQSKKDYVI